MVNELIKDLEKLEEVAETGAGFSIIRYGSAPQATQYNNTLGII